ncbi:hypothetical protein SRHO_G00118010 [Serrasalmus rhombeus]
MLGSLVLVWVFIFLLFLFIRTQRPKNFPPGPRPVPLFGNLFQLSITNPLKDLEKLAERYGNVCSLYIGGTPAVVLTGLKAVKEAFVNKAADFSGRPQNLLISHAAEGKGIVLLDYGPTWKEHRRFAIMTLRNFGMGKQSMEDRILGETEHLVKRLEKSAGIFITLTLLQNYAMRHPQPYLPPPQPFTPVTISNHCLQWTPLTLPPQLECTVMLHSQLIRTQRPKNFPPGPRPVPLFGNLFQLSITNPLKDLEKLAERYGNVCSLYIGGTPAVVLTGLKAVKEAFVNKAADFSGRPQNLLISHAAEGKGIVLLDYGPTWKEHRRFAIMTLRNFGMGKQSMEDRIMGETEHLVKRLEKSAGPRGPRTFLLDPDLCPYSGTCFSWTSPIL